MALGVYVHIPYCLQRCPYCDFSTYVWDEILPPNEYIEILLHEIRTRTHGMQKGDLKTIYFGGGTPSLIEAPLIISVINELEKVGFRKSRDCEVTIEINPATVKEDKLDQLIEGGVNRFSVGAQTFDDELLKVCGRKHTAKDTVDTLTQLNRHGLNFSLDILFALPGQSLNQLQLDVKTALSLGPKHISPYCLTLPDNHPMQVGRPLEEQQIEMFDLIHNELESNDIFRYEISNYAKLGFESQHNLLYWTDENFLGFGVSAHSYLKNERFGHRFWNAASLDAYVKQVKSLENSSSTFPVGHFPDSQIEEIKEHQALTDFCHTSLRLKRGLHVSELKAKFATHCVDAVGRVLDELITGPCVRESNSSYQLTDDGLLASNKVFEKLTFLPEDI